MRTTQLVPCKFGNLQLGIEVMVVVAQLNKTVNGKFQVKATTKRTSAIAAECLQI
jgi:hypothetical protein